MRLMQLAERMRGVDDIDFEPIPNRHCSHDREYFPAWLFDDDGEL